MYCHTCKVPTWQIVALVLIYIYCVCRNRNLKHVTKMGPHKDRNTCAHSCFSPQDNLHLLFQKLFVSFWRGGMMWFSQHGKSHLSNNTCRRTLLSFLQLSGCAAVAGGRLQARYLMCSDLVTLAKLATDRWQTYCGFIYTKRWTV